MVIAQHITKDRKKEIESMQLKNDGFDWIRKKKKLRTFYEMILQGKKIPADKTERIESRLENIESRIKKLEDQ
jgi:hypothetical protein